MYLCCPIAQKKKSGKVSPLVDAHQLTTITIEPKTFEPPVFYNQLSGPAFIESEVDRNCSVRKYTESSWLSTIVAGGADISDAWTMARPRLSAYFSGANRNRVKIPRTCPVLCTIKQRNLLDVRCLKGDDSESRKDSFLSNETDNTRLNISTTSSLPLNTSESITKKYVRFRNDSTSTMDETEMRQSKHNGKSALTTPSKVDADTHGGHRVFKFSSFVPSTDIKPLDRRLFFEHSDVRTFFVNSDRKLSLQNEDKWTELRSNLELRLRSSGQQFDEDGCYFAFYSGRQTEEEKRYGEVWLAVRQGGPRMDEDA